MEQYFNILITFCKPCKLFLNLWFFNLFSVLKVSNGFNPNPQDFWLETLNPSPEDFLFGTYNPNPYKNLTWNL